MFDSAYEKLIKIRYIGYLAQIVAAVYRLPFLREKITRQEGAWQSQFPQLLQTISRINHQQMVLEKFATEYEATRQERDNFIKSGPVALRQLARQIQENANQLQEMADQLLDQSNSLSNRIEFVRNEVLFEMQTRSRGQEHARRQTETRIINPEKIESAKREGLKLNLGCGHLPLDGYINIDRRLLPGVDLVAEVSALPFDSGEVVEIFSGHLLEHFPQEQLRRKLLPYWMSLLRPGGRFHAIVPDTEAMLREYHAGRYAYDDMREVMFGSQDYDGNFHFNMFTPDALGALLREVGFLCEKIEARGRRNGKCYEFEISASVGQLGPRGAEDGAQCG